MKYINLIVLCLFSLLAGCASTADWQMAHTGLREADSQLEVWQLAIGGDAAGKIAEHREHLRAIAAIVERRMNDPNAPDPTPVLQAYFTEVTYVVATAPWLNDRQRAMGLAGINSIRLILVFAGVDLSGVPPSTTDPPKGGGL